MRKEIEMIKTDNVKQQGEINMLRQDHSSKFENLDDKIDELKDTLKELTKEIKALNIEFAKALSDNKKKDF